MGLDTSRFVRPETGGSNAVVFVNFGWRVLQFLIGLIVLIIYVIQPAYSPWHIYDPTRNGGVKFSLGIAAGALALATTPFLAIIPFFLGYQPVAFAFVWDFIVMAVYAATFAYFKTQFPYGALGDAYRLVYTRETGLDGGRIDAMRAAVTIDLVGMILWLITFLMAVGVLAHGWIRGRGLKR